MLEYTRDIPGDSSDDVIQKTYEHVRAELSAQADSDDDPDTRSEDVDVITIQLEDGRLRIRGYLDAEADAPYLKDDYEPFADVPDELLAVLRG